MDGRCADSSPRALSFGIRFGICRRVCSATSVPDRLSPSTPHCMRALPLAAFRQKKWREGQRMRYKAPVFTNRSELARPRMTHRTSPAGSSIGVRKTSVIRTASHDFPPLNDGSEPDFSRGFAISALTDVRLAASSCNSPFRTNASISARTESLANRCAGKTTFDDAAKTVINDSPPTAGDR